MKKILLLLFLSGSIYSQAQFPITSTSGNSSTLQKANGAFGGMIGYVWSGSYGDTTAANATFIDGVPGAVIRTTNKLWLRNSTATAWIEIIGSGGTPSLTQYRIGIGDASNQLSSAAPITGSRALISDANGVPTHSTTTATELGYLNGVTSAIQTQINYKIDSLHISGDSIYIFRGGTGTFFAKIATYTGTYASGDIPMFDGTDFVPHTPTYDSLLTYNFRFGTSGAPSTNYLVSSDFLGNDVVAIREQEFQHLDTISGIKLSNDTLYFYPDFSDSERVSIRVIKGRPSRALTISLPSTAYFTDDFTGTNDTYINGRTTTTGGLTWAISAGSGVGVKTYTGGIVRAEIKTAIPARYYVDVTHHDIDLRGTLGAVQASSPLVFMILAFTDDNNFIYVDMATAAIRQVVAGSNTSLYGGSGTSVANDIIRCNLNGTSLDVYRNGSLIQSVSVSGSLTGTKHGIYFFDDGGASGSAITFLEGREAE